MLKLLFSSKNCYAMDKDGNHNYLFYYDMSPLSYIFQYDTLEIYALYADNRLH